MRNTALTFTFSTITFHASAVDGPVCGEKAPTFTVTGDEGAVGTHNVAVALNDAHLEGKRTCQVCRAKVNVAATAAGAA